MFIDRIVPQIKGRGGLVRPCGIAKLGGDFAMTNPEIQDEPTEVRIGNMIGKIFVNAARRQEAWVRQTQHPIFYYRA
jgi:hypothetical protein